MNATYTDRRTAPRIPIVGKVGITPMKYSPEIRAKSRLFVWVVGIAKTAPRGGMRVNLQAGHMAMRPDSRGLGASERTACPIVRG